MKPGNVAGILCTVLGLQQIRPVRVKWQSRSIVSKPVKCWLWMEGISGVPLSANSPKERLKEVIIVWCSAAKKAEYFKIQVPG